VTEGPAATGRPGVRRLVALVLLLLGLVGMHGLATTAIGREHRLPSHAASASDMGSGSVTGDHGSSGDALAGTSGSRDHAGAGGHDEHTLLARCVFVLAGFVLTVLLAVLAHARRRPVAAPAASALQVRLAPPDPPPRRPRVSL
jgi:hypothetical protein